MIAVMQVNNEIGTVQPIADWHRRAKEMGALMLVDAVPWPVADLRCDWTEDCPIEAVATAWEVYKPQLGAYVQRALDPRAAPSYGVPGDE